MHKHSGFARTDLIATLATIALAAALFIPHAMSARQRSAQFQTMDNIRAVSNGITSMATDDRLYPPSYVFGEDETSTRWRVEDQIGANPRPINGHVHFSAWLFERGYIANKELFTSPVAPRGGAPRANPGPDLADWEVGQTNELGQGPGAPTPLDRQAARMAFTANHAVMPRTGFRSSTVRRDELVRHPGEPSVSSGSYHLTRAWQIEDTSHTCLLTEFHYSESVGWGTVARSGFFQSHRPITPFLGRSAGAMVYNESLGDGSIPRFEYPRESSIVADDEVGYGAIEDARTSINAMGRLQPGGKAHMAMVDGSVLLKRPVESVTERLWGERFYAITGRDDVLPPQ